MITIPYWALAIVPLLATLIVLSVKYRKLQKRFSLLEQHQPLLGVVEVTHLQHQCGSLDVKVRFRYTEQERIEAILRDLKFKSVERLVIEALLLWNKLYTDRRKGLQLAIIDPDGKNSHYLETPGLVNLRIQQKMVDVQRVRK